MTAKIVPVILSGGAGTRLWPMSRALYPKQLLPLVTERTLLQETAARTVGPKFAAPIVVANHEHRFAVAEQLRAIGIAPRALVLEPVGRNTAPAVAAAALLALRGDPEALILVLPSDHDIRKPDAFRAAVETAAEAATAGALVTFGITPTAPETGYGYIKRGTLFPDVPGCFKVKQFVEKPDRKTAESYLAEGGYAWNSGMFLFGAKRFLGELERLEPAMTEAVGAAVEQGKPDLDFFRLDAEAFGRSPSKSIDYAVMEHTAMAAVVPADLGWSDVGSWSALWEIDAKDSRGNAVHGDVVVLDVANSYLRAENQLLAAVGIHDLVVVATDDAVLVAPRARAQEVKDLVDRIKAEARSEHEIHTRVHRPWGWYQGIDVGPTFQVKHILVKPGARLSLQSHNRRSEHWVVVAGVARVTRGDEVFDLAANQSTYIPLGMKHRLENPGPEPLRIIEVQSGDYLGEDDIVRYEDTYGRN